MKRLLGYLLAIIGIVVIGCSRSNEVEEPKAQTSISEDTVLPKKLAIIKLPSELQNQVFVSPIVDSVVLDTKTYNYTLYYDDGLVLCNPTRLDSALSDFATTYLKIVGTNPYIVLDNGYIIVDWKWSHFQPLSGGFRYALYSNAYHAYPGYSIGTRPVINETYYVLSMNWQDISDLTSIWSIDEGTLIQKPEIRYITLKDIVKYADSQEEYLEPCDLFTLYRLYEKDSEQCSKSVIEYDKAQSFYVKTLNRMINNNDFEKCTQNE